MMIITAKIHTNSNEFKIIKKDNIFHIYLKNKPEKNKANQELIKELTKIYGSCRIIKGKSSKTKILEINKKL